MDNDKKVEGVYGENRGGVKETTTRDEVAKRLEGEQVKDQAAKSEPETKKDPA